MSFVGSLFLTGVGALVYKFDVNQTYKKHPASDIGLKQYRQKVYGKKGEDVSRIVSRIMGNFFNDFFDGSAFLYPFKGIREFFRHKSEYAAGVLGVLSTYLLMYAVVSLVYWATITPVYTAIFAIFGPAGMLVAWIHSFLHTNVLTMMFMRLCHFNNHLSAITFKEHGYASVFNKEPVKYYVPMASPYFWLFHMPLKIFKYFVGITALSGLLVISSLPLIGPPAFNYLVSPFIAKIYFSKVLRMKGWDNLQRSEEFYAHFGQYFAFGLSCGLLENIPILAGFVLCTNTIGGALWGIENTLQA